MTQHDLFDAESAVARPDAPTGTHAPSGRRERSQGAPATENQRIPAKCPVLMYVYDAGNNARRARRGAVVVHEVRSRDRLGARPYQATAALPEVQLMRLCGYCPSRVGIRIAYGKPACMVCLRKLVAALDLSIARARYRDTLFSAGFSLEEVDARTEKRFPIPANKESK